MKLRDLGVDLEHEEDAAVFMGVSWNAKKK